MEYQRELGFTFPLMRGDDVTVVQLALTALRTVPPCGSIDGIYGSSTRLAVMEFQRTHGLEVDGVVGPKTWSALLDMTDQKQAPSGILRTAAASLSPPEKRFPLTMRQAVRARDWIMDNFGDRIAEGVKGTKLDSALVCAIACKETAPVWIHWITQLSPREILARCVFDASGDYPGKKRASFPKNTAEFRERYGAQLTDELIAEANETRRLRGYDGRQWVYKGYGIFQYDLQHIDKDHDFFAQKRWYSFDICLDRLIREMDDKLKTAANLHDAIRMYNGTGSAAEEYRDQVVEMWEWLKPTPAAESPTLAGITAPANV